MPTDRPIPQMYEDEVRVNDAMVRALLKEQFPEWADESLVRIADSGTDDAIYRLGDDMGRRLPRIHCAEAQIEKEWRWLAKLAEELPVPVPEPHSSRSPISWYIVTSGCWPGRTDTKSGRL